MTHQGSRTFGERYAEFRGVVRRCRDDSCDLPHCAVCGAHMPLAGRGLDLICDTCEAARRQERGEDAC
jgi:tRNA(Ile2) C34 agmatinyltransferase TiaS